MKYSCNSLEEMMVNTIELTGQLIISVLVFLPSDLRK